MRVLLFITCLTDTLFPHTGQATVAVLERLGVEVDFPAGQTCCGQMHANAGYGADALRLVRRFVEVFDSAESIVTPSASCASMIQEQYRRLAEEACDIGLLSRIEELRPRVHELSRFLVDVLGVEDVGAHYPHRVAYHPSCHGLRSLPGADAPLRLLRTVDGIELVSLPESTSCCGFGGAFAIKNAAVSAAMLEDKIGCIEASGAEVCVATDSSCLMHIGGGLSRLQSAVRTAHLAEVLAGEGHGAKPGAS